MTAITVPGVLNPRTGFSSSGVPEMFEDLLDDGHYIEGRLPFSLVYPRPDSETPSHARHRNFHSDFRYEIPIEVEGGAWPYKYIILDSPAGATIGASIISTDYGVLKWTPSGQTGTVRFTVLIVDQDGITTSATWTVTLDNGRFIVISAATGASGTGTIASPLKTFADYYISDADASFNNKILVWRTGTYTVLGDTGNVQIGRTTKTPSWIGYPDEVAEFDCTGAVFLTDQAQLDDIFVYNLTFKNARQDVLNSRFWFVRSDILSRAVFSKCTFKDMPSGGTSGNDNAGPVFVSSTVNNKNYIAITKNIFDNIISLGFNGHYCDLYNSSHVLISDNVVSNSHTDYGFYAKYTNEYITIRNNIAVDNNNGRQITLGMGQSLPRYHEVCYNRCAIPIGSANSVFTMAMDDVNKLNIQDNYVYRNTFCGGRFVLRFLEADPVKFDANIVVASNTTTDIPVSNWVADIASNILTSSATNLLDPATALLTGAGRTANIGIKGAEIE